MCDGPAGEQISVAFKDPNSRGECIDTPDRHTYRIFGGCIRTLRIYKNAGCEDEDFVGSHYPTDDSCTNVNTTQDWGSVKAYCHRESGTPFSDIASHYSCQ